MFQPCWIAISHFTIVFLPSIVIQFLRTRQFFHANQRGSIHASLLFLISQLFCVVIKINFSFPKTCLIPGEDGRVRPAEQGERGLAEQAELDVDGGRRLDYIAPRGRELAAGGRRQEEGPLHPQDHQGQAS